MRTTSSFLPRRGLNMIVKRMIEAKNGYDGEGNFRYVKVENT